MAAHRHANRRRRFGGLTAESSRRANTGQHLEAKGNVARGLKSLRRVFFEAVPDDVR